MSRERLISGVKPDLVKQATRCLADARIRVTDFHTIVPTLEDVFLKLTWHTVRQ